MGAARIVGTVLILSLPGLGLFALAVLGLIALAAVAAVAAALVAVPVAVVRAIGRHRRELGYVTAGERRSGAIR
jgi:hypothetical protein